MRDGIQYLVVNNCREWRTDKRPPGDCDKCGGRHCEWLCGKAKSIKSRDLMGAPHEPTTSLEKPPGSDNLGRWFNEFVAACEDLGSITWWSIFLQS